jgi:hypothetical protein
MNLETILSKQTPLEYSMEEITFVIEEFIRISSNKVIKYNPYKCLSNIDKSLHIVILQQENMKFINAFNIALDYFYSSST